MRVTFDALDIASLGGGAPARARSRNANPANGVVHQVIVMPSDRGETIRAALCGFRPRAKRGQALWVFMPSWPKKDCAKCLQVVGG